MDEHRENAISTITLTPTPEDNGAVYSCEAVHKALFIPMISYVELSVLCKYCLFCIPENIQCFFDTKCFIWVKYK